MNKIKSQQIQQSIASLSPVERERYFGRNDEYSEIFTHFYSPSPKLPCYLPNIEIDIQEQFLGNFHHGPLCLNINIHQFDIDWESYNKSYNIEKLYIESLIK